MRGLLLATVLLTAAGCRSPFGMESPPEEDPRVGRGVHAWPILEVAYEGDGRRTDVLWPLSSFYSGEDSGGSRADLLFPIVHWSRDGDTVRYALRPLFDVETDETADDVDLLWPLFKWRAEAEETRLSLLYVFPLYDHEVRADYDRLSAGIVYHRKTSPGDSYLWLWPLFGHSDEGGRTKTWVLPPLFGHGRSADGGRQWVETDLLWPLFHYEREDDTVSLRAFPLLWQTVGPDATDRVLFPFWWQFDDADSSFRLLLPVYGRQTEGEDFARTFFGGPLFIHTRDGDERTYDLLWPLFGYRTDGEATSLRAFPVLFTHRSPEESYTYLWPLFGYEEDRAAGGWEVSTLTPFFRYASGPGSTEVGFPWPVFTWEGFAEGHDFHLFPFFHSERRGKRSEGSVLLKLADWESDEEKGTSDFRILWRLVQVTDGEHKDVTVVNPFYRHEENDRGDTYWSVFFGLLARKVENGETDWRVLWLF